MSSLFSLSFSCPVGSTTDTVFSTGHKSNINAFLRNLQSLERGSVSPVVVAMRDALVQASGTVTCATVIATNTVTVGGVVFTAVTGASTGDQFTRGVSDTADAAALAATINASTTVGAAGCFTATSAAAVVTITAALGGKMGNAITLASSGATLTVSAARLAGGLETLTTYSSQD